MAPTTHVVIQTSMLLVCKLTMPNLITARRHHNYLLNAMSNETNCDCARCLKLENCVMMSDCEMHLISVLWFCRVMSAELHCSP